MLIFLHKLQSQDDRILRQLGPAQALTLLNSVTQLSKTSVIITNPQGIVLDANDYALRITGLSRNELVGKPYDLTVSPEQDIDVFNNFLNALHTAQKWDGTLYTQQKGGVVIEHTRIIPITDEQDNVIYLSILKKNITDERNLQSKVREMATREAEIINNIPDSIITTDESGRITSWNQTAEGMFGYSPKDILGKPLETILPKLDLPISRRTQLAPQTGTAKKGDGQEIQVHYSLSPYIDQHGKPGSVLIIRDISELVKIKSQLETAKKEEDFGFEVGKKIQDSFFPPINFYDTHLDVHYLYRYLDVVGGDMFLMNRLPDNSIATFIGDVAGHGLSAAWITILVKMHWDLIMKNFQQDPNYVLQQINRVIIEHNTNIANRPKKRAAGEVDASGDIMTALCGLLTPQIDGTVIFTWAKGGHPFPVIYRQDSDSLEILKSKGLLLGIPPIILSDQKYELSSTTLWPGDILYVMTDGITETHLKPDQRALYSEPDWLDLFRPIDSAASAESIVHRIYETLKTMRYGNQDDDIALSAFKVKHPQH